MLGAIIGDVVGSRWEFAPTNDYNFEWLSDKNSYTDDTICTVAVADALLQGSDDFGKFLHEWCRRYPHPMGGYGGRFAQWVFSDHPEPYNSYGNGAAMRVSPIAWAFLNSYFNFFWMAEKSAECTHNHPEGIKGANAVVYAIIKAVKMRKAQSKPLTPEQLQEFVEVCGQYSEYNILIRREDVENKFDETCQGTVPVALWIIGQSNSFEDAIRRAVSLGADADTLGAIVGSIAEAIWGIPIKIVADVFEYLPEEMKEVISDFYCRFEPPTILEEPNEDGAIENNTIRNLFSQHGCCDVEHIEREEEQNPLSEVARSYIEAISNIAKDETQKDKSYLFKTFDAMSLEEGYTLGLKYPAIRGLGDVSELYTYRIGQEEEKETEQENTPDELNEEKEPNPFEHIQVEPTEKGFWQAYFFFNAPTLLPTFWHGEYNRCTYIFSHKDLGALTPMSTLREGPLYAIKQVLSPKVTIHGNEGIIECYYWNEWQGLMRETMKITFSGKTIISTKIVDRRNLFPYDCGICF
ncbi:MAG: ADP-ribosylglycohydrolase family protein [Bacteroidales bacterium]|nr:ADP-ribosylglycohydrolase family protein [Bacteroidales bacterium]